jgi:hypothetical protein
MAVEMLEAWLLALARESGGEERADAHRRLKEEHAAQPLDGMLRIVEAAELDVLPRDAESLRAWFDRARRALSASG